MRLLFLCFLLTWVWAKPQTEALEYLNQLRQKAGLIALKEHPALSKAAKGHAAYLIYNQQSGHYQQRGKKGFRGKTPSMRVIEAGYTSRIAMENISVNSQIPKRSIDNLFSAIYHRFVFLSLSKDEIGVGFHASSRKRAIKDAFVYDLGSSTMRMLCLKEYPLRAGEYYMKGVCYDKDKPIPKEQFEAAKREIYHKNAEIILYPYAGQSGVYPAFYNESPDPLPKHKVSGFPVSVQFNPAFYADVKLLSFKLYDAKGNELKQVKILDAKSDPHHLLKAGEFALMPLVRLEYATRYGVVFEAKADGVTITKKWHFETERPAHKLYRISQRKAAIGAKAGETVLLYMVPSHPTDLLGGFKLYGGGKARFLDQHTVELTLPTKSRSGKVRISFGNHKELTVDLSPLK